MKKSTSTLLLYITLAVIFPSLIFAENSNVPGPGFHGNPAKNIVNPDATVRADTTPFQYGVNPGYYGNGWFDTDLADIASNAGSHSFRASLPDHFVQTWGYDIRLDVFKYYTQTLGMKGITLFIGEPGDSHVDKTIYPPVTEPSKIFANLYTSVWDNGENGTPVNDNNYFAAYVYNLVKIYGNYVEFWEIVNEPDFTYFWDNGNRSIPKNWYDTPPSPQDLPNLKAPIYYYIRMLRIANEIIKKYQPNAYVTPGGLGYPAFLDALLRFTDNPDGGKVTAAYPLTGGAYFDMLSFHNYPGNNLSEWDNSIGGFRWFRHSDRAVDEIFILKNKFNEVLLSHGYDGITHPKKPFILTEINIARKAFGNHFGGEIAQRNFIIKATVCAQKNNILQFYLYKVGENADYNTATGMYDLMGLYENLTRDKKGSEKLTSEGKALKTTSMLLYGWKYDATRTAALNLPNNIGGAAFNSNGKYRYVLWAKTATDLSETANGTYSFPSTFQIDSVSRFEWDYSVNSSAASKGLSQNISLTGTPSFFEEIARKEIVLPVGIVSFNAKLFGCKVVFDWKISNSIGYKLLIEESRNGEEFTPVYSAVISNENQSGSTQSELNDSGEKMYRLVIERSDKTRIYSDVKTIVSNCNGKSAQIRARPNPANDRITVSGLSDKQTITIYDTFGRKLRLLNVDSETQDIDLSNFSTSYYFLRVSDNKGNTLKTIRFLKN